MTPDSREKRLLAELLADEDLREATLRGGLIAIRRSKVQRQSIRIGAVLSAMLLFILLSRNMERTSTEVKDQHAALQSAAATPEVIPGTTVRVLKDEDLLALFPDRAVGLVGPPGKQRLILFEPVNN
jgi:hypothetical protein